MTMKKRNIINLIRYHTEQNEPGFISEAHEIAKIFDQMGDTELAEYVMSLISGYHFFVPQSTELPSEFFDKIQGGDDALLLPECIEHDLLGVINAIKRDLGLNKYLFQGAPGTGKTESAKHIAKVLNRDLYVVNFSAIVDCKLGQTQKNIVSLFESLSGFAFPEKIIVLFDEIDAIALDRTNSNDLREMGRATSTLLRELDHLDEKIILLATTNLFEHFDRALIRRFDSIVDFNRYTQEDLAEISEILLNKFLNKFKCTKRNTRLFKKIIGLMNPIPFPGELTNLIRSSVAFSDPEVELDYLRRLYKTIFPKEIDLSTLRAQGFTVREIEVLTGISKSQVARELKGIPKKS